MALNLIQVAVWPTPLFISRNFSSLFSTNFPFPFASNPWQPAFYSMNLL